MESRDSLVVEQMRQFAEAGMANLRRGCRQRWLAYAMSEEDEPES